MGRLAIAQELNEIYGDDAVTYCRDRAAEAVHRSDEAKEDFWLNLAKLAAHITQPRHVQFN